MTKKFKLKAKVAKSVKLSYDQLERLVNVFCGCVENAEVEDVRKVFREGSAKTELSYITWEDVRDALSDAPQELKEYFKANRCVAWIYI